mmetsp:Transcript_49025/g.100082  ORF Transcript_49025/g.100082 Transcript_49025/m.100082 type:complete len:99 (-) Transcript_49025:294-590(-)
MSSNRSITSIVLRVSRSPVGSSRRSRAGEFERARAMVTRCCSPPDSSDGRCSNLSLSPTMPSSSVARCCRSFLLFFPSTVIGNSTFSNADMVAKRLKV